MLTQNEWEKYSHSMTGVEHNPIQGFTLVYIVYPLANKVKKFNFEHFFDNKFDYEHDQPTQSVYMDLHAANQAARFQARNYLILKAYVPESAIEGLANELRLKPGNLDRQYIIGCYMASTEQNFYQPNPYVDERFFKQKAE